MSVEVTSVPPWKQAILERKRKQEEDDKQRTDDESVRLAQMPSWKREILLKKQNKTARSRAAEQPHKKDSEGSVGVANSNTPLTVVVSSEPVLSPSPVQVRAPSERQLSPLCPTAEYDFDSVSEESHREQDRIIPIQQNPWLKSNSVKKHNLSVSNIQDKHVDNQDSPVARESPHKQMHSWSDETDSKSDNVKVAADDDVFSEEGEMAYGRGFVHKLLQKFKNITSQSDVTVNTLTRKSQSPSTKRLASADTALDTSYKKSSPQRPRSFHTDNSLQKPSSTLTKKTQSMENIHMDCQNSDGVILSEYKPMNSSHSLENLNSEMLGYSFEDDVDVQHTAEPVAENEMPRPRIVSMTRDVFESISSPISITNALSKSATPENKHYQKPIVSGASASNDSVNKMPHTTPKENVKDSQVERPVVNEHKLVDSQDSGEIEESVHKIKTAGKSWFFSGNDSVPKTNANVAPMKRLENGDQNANYAKSNSIMSVQNLNEPTISGKQLPVNVKNKKIEKTETIHNSGRIEDQENSNSNIIEKTTTYSSAKTEKVHDKVNSFSKENIDAPDSKPKPNHVLARPAASPQKNRKPDRPSSQEVDSTQESRKPDPNRLNLNLDNLSAKKSEKINAKIDHQVVKTSAPPPQKNVVNYPKQKNKVATKKAEPKGPGSLLIRPASNLVVGATKTENLQLTRYNDVKTGEFAPAKKRPGYYDTYSDSEEEDIDEIPITNIDDCLVPSSNIDDLSPREGDAAHHKASRSSKWDFVGAGVTVGKSSLSKSHGHKMMRIQFGEEIATSTFEYPSEQFLLASIPPQPGDFDHPDTIKNQRPPSPDISDMPDMEQPTSGLKSTPLASGSLSSYKSKSSGDYKLGLDTYQLEMERKKASPPQSPQPEPETMKPADEDFTWSESSSADLLF